MLNRIKQLLADVINSSEIAVLSRSNWLADHYEQLLSEYGLPAERMDANFNLMREGISCGTMHRAKGLEFRVVILVGISEQNLLPRSRIEATTDLVMREQMEREESSLLYVAATRARDMLVVTSSDNPSKYWPLAEPLLKRM